MYALQYKCKLDTFNSSSTILTTTNCKLLFNLFDLKNILHLTLLQFIYDKLLSLIVGYNNCVQFILHSLRFGVSFMPGVFPKAACICDGVANFYRPRAYSYPVPIYIYLYIKLLIVSHAYIYIYMSISIVGCA